MSATILRSAVLAVALALGPSPAFAQAALYPPNVYPDLINCYVAYAQDRADAIVRGDAAREAAHTAHSAAVLDRLAVVGQALGKTGPQVGADIQAGMDAYFAALSSGAIIPGDLANSVAGCDAWMASDRWP